MYSITLNVESEEELYNSLDPQQNLLADNVKAYVYDKLQARDQPDGVELCVCSKVPIDEERFKSAIDRLIEEENRSIHASRKRNRIQQALMFGAGVLFIALSLALQPVVNVVWFTVLSTIGAFSMWEAASIWIVRGPQLRLREFIVSRLSKQLTYRFTTHG